MHEFINNVRVSRIRAVFYFRKYIIIHLGKQDEIVDA